MFQWSCDWKRELAVLFIEWRNQTMHGNFWLGIPSVYYGTMLTGCFECVNCMDTLRVVKSCLSGMHGSILHFILFAIKWLPVVRLTARVICLTWTCSRTGPWTIIVLAHTHKPACMLVIWWFSATMYKQSSEVRTYSLAMYVRTYKGLSWHLRCSGVGPATVNVACTRLLAHSLHLKRCYFMSVLFAHTLVRAAPRHFTVEFSEMFLFYLDL